MTVKKKKQVAVAKKRAPAPAVVESPAGQVMHSLTTALESGTLQPDQLTMILDAQERVLDRQASMDFAAALAACQMDMPSVTKTQYNEQTKSMFENLESMNKAISPVYTKHGFSVTFGTDQSPLGDDFIRVTADLTHSAGHSKHYFYDLPYDLAGIKGSVNKTKIHASASTLTYGRRYLLKLIFNLTTADDIDDDANAAGADAIELVTEAQIMDIESLISEVGADHDAFLRVCKVESFDQLPASKYHGAIGMLEAKRETA